MRLSKENTISSKMYLLRYVFVEQWAFEILNGPKCEDRNFLVLPRTFATTDRVHTCATFYGTLLIVFLIMLIRLSCESISILQ